MTCAATHIGEGRCLFKHPPAWWLRGHGATTHSTPMRRSPEAVPQKFFVFNTDSIPMQVYAELFGQSTAQAVGLFCGQERPSHIHDASTPVRTLNGRVSYKMRHLYRPYQVSCCRPRQVWYQCASAYISGIYRAESLSQTIPQFSRQFAEPTPTLKPPAWCRERKVDMASYDIDMRHTGRWDKRAPVRVNLLCTGG